MKISIEPHYDVLIVKLDGSLDTRSAGVVSDALVEQIRIGWRKLVVDVAGLTTVTRGGVRALVVAATMLREQLGQMLICHADAGTEAFLKRVSFQHLLHFDEGRDTAVARLGYKRREDAPTAATRRETLGLARATALAAGAPAGGYRGALRAAKEADGRDRIPAILRTDYDRFRKRPRRALSIAAAAPIDR